MAEWLLPGGWVGGVDGGGWKQSAMSESTHPRAAKITKVGRYIAHQLKYIYAKFHDQIWIGRPSKSRLHKTSISDAAFSRWFGHLSNNYRASCLIKLLLTHLPTYLKAVHDLDWRTDRTQRRYICTPIARNISFCRVFAGRLASGADRCRWAEERRAAQESHRWAQDEVRRDHVQFTRLVTRGHFDRNIYRRDKGRGFVLDRSVRCTTSNRATRVQLSLTLEISRVYTVRRHAEWQWNVSGNSHTKFSTNGAMYL